jgi:hypothetical protein
VEDFSPRTVQARVRAGASPQAVASETGWPLEKVMRYAEPLLSERAFIVEQAQMVTLHREGLPLVEIAAQTAEAMGLSSPVWDSARHDDARWFVTASTDGHEAIWTFDSTGRTVQAQNTFARVLMGLSEEPPAETRPRLVAVPEQHNDNTAEVDIESDPVTARHDTLTLPIPDSPAQPSPKKRGKSKRASVPSWDEILFGTQREND